MHWRLFARPAHRAFRFAGQVGSWTLYASDQAYTARRYCGRAYAGFVLKTEQFSRI